MDLQGIPRESPSVKIVVFLIYSSTEKGKPLEIAAVFKELHEKTQYR